VEAFAGGLGDPIVPVHRTMISRRRPLQASRIGLWTAPKG
jgi:hypothetical protein